MNEFNATKWREELTMNIVSFQFFYSVVSDDDLARSFITRLVVDAEGETISKPITEALPQDSIDRISLFYQELVERAQATYLRQMIVVMATYSEAILNEFFFCLFATHPNRMHNYLTHQAQKDMKGKVDLKEIIEANSKDELIESLARRAATFVSQGGFDATISALKKVTRSPMDSMLETNLKTLMKWRNSIVHEATTQVITSEQVEAVDTVVVSLLDFLCDKCEADGIPFQNSPAPTQFDLSKYGNNDSGQE